MPKKTVDADTSAAAAILGRRGGTARAKKLSPEQRRQIAQKAGQTRWEKEENSTPATVGSKGGKARAKKLSAQQRKAIAQKAAQARWAKQDS